jgi:hypothetical protein
VFYILTPPSLLRGLKKLHAKLSTKKTGPKIHHFDLYRLGGAGGGRISPGSRPGHGAGSEEQGGGADSAASAPSISALDAERCGLVEALGLVPPTEAGRGGAGGGGGLGVSLVEWADRLGGGGGNSDDGAAPSAPAASSSAAAADAPLLLPSDRVLEVSIEPLPADRALELSARHPRLLASSAEEEGVRDGGEAEDGEEGEDEDEIEPDEFADTRWRRITLRPRGLRAREAAVEAARALRDLNASGERVAIEEEEEEEEGEEGEGEGEGEGER